MFFSVSAKTVFFVQGFCPVNHVSNANYATVKPNPKSVMAPGKSHVFNFLVNIFMFFLFYSTFFTSGSRYNGKLCKRKTQSKNRNDSRKIVCFFSVSAKTFYDLPFLCKVSAQ